MAQNSKFAVKMSDFADTRNSLKSVAASINEKGVAELQTSHKAQEVNAAIPYNAWHEESGTHGQCVRNCLLISLTR